MEFHAIDAGWLSILPPIVAIVLALITKEVISSLFIGIAFGVITYSFSSGGGIIKAMVTMFQLMVSKLGGNLNIVLFLAILGIIVVLVTKAGGSQAYGNWAATKIKSKSQALLATSALGIIIFVDDYFNCLTVGTVMKPVTDKYKIARAKLAYIIDSTAAPVCIIAPISSWAAAVGSTLGDADKSGMFKSDLMAFIQTIPYNLYAILTLIMVIVVSVTHLNYGPMRKFETRAGKGDMGALDSAGLSDEEISDKGKVIDLIIPIFGLIIFSIMFMLYTGGFFGPEKVGIVKAIGNCDSSSSLVYGGFTALLLTFILYVPRKILSYKDFFGAISTGVQAMVPAILILTFAWTIGGVCRDLLSTGQFVGHLVQVSHFPLFLLPVVIFIVAAFLSFSMGTAWGTFGILIPIVTIICSADSSNITLLITALSATLGGSVFGDHCSPISDTTILSSTGAQCSHMDHVSSQMPYAISVAGCCIIGYLIGALTGGNLFATLGSGILSLVIVLVIMSKRAVKQSKKSLTEG